MQKVRVFLASSNAMMEQRELVQTIVDELNQSLCENLDHYIELYRWEKSVIPQMGRPQEIIFKQSDFASIDVFIGLLGNYFGTATGAVSSDGYVYGSGTEEEFCEAYSSFKKTGKPQIMIFRSISMLNPDDLNIEQFSKVGNFIKKLEANNDYPGIYLPYKTDKELEFSVRRSLTVYLLNTYKKSNQEGSNDWSLSGKYKQNGYETLYVYQNNEERNQDKKSAMNQSKIIYLMAKTGNSFISNVGNRFKSTIEEAAQNGSDVRLLLLNPWSSYAVQASFIETFSAEQYKDFVTGKITGEEAYAMYTKSDWFSIKLRDSLNGC